MFWVVLAARLFVGLPFVAFSLNYFFHLFPMPAKSLPEAATHFVGALASSGYMNVVKVLELTGGLMLISGRLVPLGLVLLTPIAVNILLYEIFLLGSAGPGLPLTVMCFALVWAYRSHFAAVFALKPRIG